MANIHNKTDRITFAFQYLARKFQPSLLEKIEEIEAYKLWKN